LKEVPATLIENVRGDQGHVDLYAERAMVRDANLYAGQRNLYTGKTYNSVDAIQQFFAGGLPKPVAPPKTVVPVAPGAPVKKKKFGPGSTIEHAKYGHGTVLRLEGTGEDTKVTVSFPGHGLKKLIAKYAGIKVE
jgi:DNA helicase-2/ATP-dependent DNA helicase PcrA